MTDYVIETQDGPSFVYTPDGNKLVYQQSGEAFVIDPGCIGKGMPMYDRLVRLILGTKCNYNCAYCSQAFSRKSVTGATLKDVDQFLLKAKPFLSSVDRIEFWGGEPLVYIKHLYRLIPTLREWLPDARFTIVSNGALLTDEIGDFLAKYRICYTISHDAYAHKTTRGEDPLDDPEKIACIRRTFKKINDAVSEYSGDKRTVCGITITFSKAVRDPLKVKAWFDEKLGESVPVSCDPVLSIGQGKFNDEVQMTESELRELCHNVFVAGMQNPGTYPYSLANKGMEFIRGLFSSLSLADAAAFCGVTTNNITAIDLKGNLYSCQNQLQPHQILGNVFEGQTKPRAFIDYRNRECCSNCPVVMICRGGCSLASIDRNAFVETCQTKFWYSLGIFMTAFTRLTGYKPVRIKGKMVRPKKQLVQTEHGAFAELNSIDLP